MNLFFTFIILTLSNLSFAGNSCSSHFDTVKTDFLISDAVKLKEPTLFYKIYIKSDNRFIQNKVSKEDLVDLFQMFGQTQFFNVSEKLTLEKGSLFLGRKIDEWLTAQAEYIYDKPNQALHLSRITIVNSKNGQEQILTKEPLDYTGTQLVKNEFNVVFEKGSPTAKIVSPNDIKVDDPSNESSRVGAQIFSLNNENIRSTDVLFPIAVSGESFNKIKKWASIIPYLDHSEISIAGSIKNQNWALMKGQYRRFAEFAKDRFFKQAFGLIIIYAIIDGMNSFSGDVAKYMVDVVQEQKATLSVKVKETRVDGTVTNSEQKFKIIFPEKAETSNKAASGVIK